MRTRPLTVLVILLSLAAARASADPCKDEPSSTLPPYKASADKVKVDEYARWLKSELIESQGKGVPASATALCFLKDYQKVKKTGVSLKALKDEADIALEEEFDKFRTAYYAWWKVSGPPLEKDPAMKALQDDAVAEHKWGPEGGVDPSGKPYKLETDAQAAADAATALKTPKKLPAKLGAVSPFPGATPAETAAAAGPAAPAAMTPECRDWCSLPASTRAKRATYQGYTPNCVCGR